MILTTDRTREISRLVHRRRIQIDPAFRAELLRLFDNPRARMAYFSKHGLRIDDLGEALWDAGLTVSRPTCDEVLQLLEDLFTPLAGRAKVTKQETSTSLSSMLDGFEHELEVRRKNRWRSFACDCFNSAKIRATKDALPPALAAAICEECGSPWTLRTIKLDMSNRMAPMSAEGCYQ